MDERRFDGLVKHIASTSRRQLLASLLGGLAAAGIHEGDAAKDKPKKCGGKPCGSGNTCLTGRGKPVCCPDARVCGMTCLTAACAAPCQTCDPMAGACVNACPSGHACVNGECAAIVCPTEQTGCCTCNYQETATGNFISTCHITRGCPGCNEICQANVPAGTTQVGQATGCSTDLPVDLMYVCNDISSPPRFTGFACGGTACTTAGT